MAIVSVDTQRRIDVDATIEELRKKADEKARKEAKDAHRV